MSKWILGITLGLVAVAGCNQKESAPERVGRPASEFRQAPPQQEPRSAVIWVKGLSCPLCVQAIKKELAAVKGVEQIDVNYENESATVNFSRKPPTREQLVKAVERTGYVLTKLEMQ